MMQQTLRPYLTSGVAVVGAGLIAVAPIGPRLPEAGLQPAHSQPHAVALTADGFFDPWQELFTNTANNLAALNASTGFQDLLHQLFTDPLGSFQHLSNAIALLTTLLPDISASLHGLPLTLGVELTPQLANLLSGLGPLITVFNAFNDILNQLSNPAEAFGALVNAPAILLNAYLNGTADLDLGGGVSAPLFNGILVPAQSFDLTANLGQLIDQTGVGGTTITGLLDQAGVGNQSIAGLASSLLDSAGLGNLTPVGLLDHFGLGQDSIAGLTIDLLKTMGIDNPSISDLAQQLTGGDQTVSSLLSSLLNQAGFGDPTITDLLDQFGLGDETIGGLLKELLAGAGFDNPTITQVVEQLGFNLNVPDLATTLLGDNPSVSSLLSGLLGVPNPTVGDLFTLLLGDQPGDIGTMTVKDLFDTLTDATNNDAPLGGYTLADFVIYLLNQANPSLDWTLSEALQNLGLPLDPNDPTNTTPLGDWTLGQLLAQAPDTANEPFKTLLNSIDFNGGPLGNQNLGDLGNLSTLECIGLATITLGAQTCSTTLNDMMGNRTVLQTMENLFNTQHKSLADMDLNQLLTATGEGNVRLSDVLTNLQSDQGLTTTMDQILTTLGLDNEPLNSVLVNGWHLNNTTVEQLLDDFGLGNINLSGFLSNLGLDNITLNQLLSDLGMDTLHINTLIDGLGLSDPDMSLNSLLSDWGLNNLDVDTFLDRMLGNLTVGNLLNNLDLNNVHLNDVLNDLLGGTTLSQVLTNIGLDSTDVNTILDNLGLDNITVNQVLSSLGLNTVTVDHILDSMGLSGTDILDLHAGDFAGLLPQLFDVIPQQIAGALGG